MEYGKVKSVSKQVLVKGPALEKIILDSMKLAADIVGSTLGPGGSPVLIERQEHGLLPVTTKDGVSVFRSLGFQGSAAQVVMEAARDAAVRTAQEAGDGTTSATVLAEAFVRLSLQYVKKNPKASPQKVVRLLEKTFHDLVLPAIEKEIVHLGDRADRKTIMKNVAKTSTNGDEALAEAVIECFDLVGDDGNVTISEVSGPSGYEVEKIEGFPVPLGYEDSAQKFYSKFINDPANQRCILERPMFLVYHGRILDIQSILPLMNNIWESWQKEGTRHNIVIVATGFSESFLANLALNFQEKVTVNLYPMLAPQSAFANGQLNFLEDVAAITGAVLLDPINLPLERATMDDLGYGDGLKSFEATRYRSTIVGYADEEAVLEQVDTLKAQLENPGSDWDATILRERIAKLTGGIAKLRCVGASGGETKEKRDRAEDAVCAVRGAIKKGVLPGGGWTFLKVTEVLKDNVTNSLELTALHKDVLTEIFIPAINEPVNKLLDNCGFDQEEIAEILEKITGSLSTLEPLVYNAYEGTYVNPYESGVLDSSPAVVEALRNSLSIASLLGTLGGCVVFARDADLERKEAQDVAQFLKETNPDLVGNPADNRAA